MIDPPAAPFRLPSIRRSPRSTAPLASLLLQPGQRAPAFTLPADDGEPFRLTGCRGQWVVLYFYPKDHTPGCSAEACAFRDRMRDFSKAGAAVLGVSPDGVESHARFRKSLSLNFPLLCDRDARVAAKYGAWREKQNYGRKYLGIVRATFLIDPAGKIAASWDNVRVKGHQEKVLARLREELQA